MKPYLYVHRKSRFASKKSVKKIESKNLNRKHIFLRIISKKKIYFILPKSKEKIRRNSWQTKIQIKKKKKRKERFH